MSYLYLLYKNASKDNMKVQMNLMQNKKGLFSVISIHNFSLKCVPKCTFFFQILEISFHRILKYIICKQIRMLFI